ncbi:MAG: glycosyltransferase family 2 protein [Chitinispirillales bacterium]|jgi:glycosyltransferase involved in cell wall biosynthesis|nr:glycosyltransferase family 2 protein [Chitinispirillales bacterium]
MSKPLFSIITPMYDGAAFIGETIGSVLRQTFADWEMVVVDDCSPDGGAGAAVVGEHAMRDPRIRLVRSPDNRGSSGARNLAMEGALGRYYAFLDADDLWDADYLERMKRRMGESADESAAIYFCGYRRKDSACRREILPPYKSAGKKDFKKMLYHCPIFPSASILDTWKLKEKPRFNESLKNLRDDYVLWLSIMKQGLTAIGYDDILVDYRMRDDSLTASKRNMIYPQWNIYRSVLKMGIIQSAFYTISWAINGALKYRYFKI